MSSWVAKFLGAAGQNKNTLENQHSKTGYRFAYNVLQQATNNFDENRVVGVGGFGKVYMGVLRDETMVAVKRGNPTSQQGPNEFRTEIELLSHLRHRHLVSLLGYYDKRNEMILVYDYMEQGTLTSHLYGSHKPSLNWEQRLQICIGAARGLHYLHTGFEKVIIHRDVKSLNILLDGKLVAKVADFGLSKIVPGMDQSHVKTAVKGSFGYLDPEYFRSEQLTVKSDVYSFGVVLLEVLCARPVIDRTLPRETVSLVEWGMKWKERGELHRIVDPIISGTIRPASLKKFGEIVEKCLANNGADRPTMEDILRDLNYVLQLQRADSPVLDGNTMNVSIVESQSHAQNVGALDSTSGTVAEARPSNKPDHDLSNISMTQDMAERLPPEHGGYNVSKTKQVRATNGTESHVASCSSMNEIHRPQNKLLNFSVAHSAKITSLDNAELPNRRAHSCSDEMLMTAIDRMDDNVGLQNGDHRHKPRDTKALPDYQEVEGVYRYVPGVYITVYTHRDGTRDVTRVRFSRRQFSEHQAEKWWSDNRSKVFERFNVKSPGCASSTPSARLST